MDTLNIDRQHRTMLVIRSGNAGGEYSERASRLVESLNRSGDSPYGTIKTDIFLLTPDGVLLSGAQRVRGNLNVDNAYEVGKVADTSEAGFQQIATEAGYSQVMILSSTYDGGPR